MSSKILFIVSCIIATKELNGAFVNPNTCGFRVGQLRSQIGIGASQCRYEVSSATTTIKTEISLAASNINTQLGALQNKVSAVCKNRLQLDLAQVNTKAAKLCFPKAEINALNLKVNQLERLKGSTSLLCDTCGQLYPLPTQIEELNNCIESSVARIANQAVDLQAQISSDASTLEGKSSVCVADAESKELKIINDASANLDKCVGTP